MPDQPNVDLTDHEQFRRLRRTDPVHWNPGTGAWSITRHADIRAVAADHDTFASAAEGGGGPDGLRRLVVPYFRPFEAAELAAETRGMIDALIDVLPDGEPFDFVSALAARLPLLVLGRLVGAPAEDCEDLLAWTNALAAEDAAPEPAAHARDALCGYFRDLEDDRRRSPREDIVTALTRAEVDGVPLARDELDAYYPRLLVAGHETTRNLLAGGMVALHRHPDEWTAVVRDPSRVPAVVEEMVRWTSPVLSMGRTAICDVELHGRRIRAGQRVVLWFCSGNRDETVFADPDRFVGDRAPNDHLGFGWGAHACLGAPLARLQTRLFLEYLVERGLRVEPVAAPTRSPSGTIEHLPSRLLKEPQPAARP
ncbi:Linalool 8-monooxygenase [Actinomadura rubteroloni]|uniref:Linalool 8-monooxygenase n=1 Tax=Actinomadura rubteroloni TaxID=1926885 RepID=A0A2P4UIR4_9ACTN|nr:cytochrome P450 [Actinomadura rubteroloni]POM24930.1 Linalool 8-monooxygenase [Actinomadura rubteroloni]